MRAREIMTSPVVSVRQETSLKEIARLLVEHGISAVPVLDADDRVVGVVSEADLLPLEAVPHLRSRVLHPVRRKGPVPRVAAEVMSLFPVTVTETTTSERWPGSSSART